MIDLKGKVAVVFGLANKRSIAYSIAQKLAEAGATLVLSYQSERLRAEYFHNGQVVPVQWIQMLPYVATLAILAGSVGGKPGRARAPHPRAAAWGRGPSPTRARIPARPA